MCRKGGLVTECNTLANRHASNPCESKNAHKNERDKERNNEFNSMLVVARAKIALAEAQLAQK